MIKVNKKLLEEWIKKRLGVYMRYHWLVDVIAGAILAFAVYLISELFWKI